MTPIRIELFARSPRTDEPDVGDHGDLADHSPDAEWFGVRSLHTSPDIDVIGEPREPTANNTNPFEADPSFSSDR